jgi:mono/diheme cytochrome c family protein
MVNKGWSERGIVDNITDIKHIRTWLGFIASGIVVLTLAGCGGLAGEPRIVSTAPLPTVTVTSPPDLGHPPTRVSIERGAEIFGGDQSCSTCHGIGGKGDGPVASNFTCPLPDFTDADFARSQRITDWFTIATQGNGSTGTTCLMPPWNARLNEQQRWDVTSYIYSIHYKPGELLQGQQIWQTSCAACHGELGNGKGPVAQKSARPVPDFTDPAYMIAISDTALFKTVTNGLGSAMPAFKDSLSDDQRWAAVAYARSLAWDRGAAPAATQAATESPANTNIATAAPDSPTVAVSGKVTNRTTGGSAIPDGQAVTLQVIDLSSGSAKGLQTLLSKTSGGGMFNFGEVQRQLNMVYVVTTDYGGLTQTSTPIRLAAGAGPSLDLSFDVYDATTSPKDVKVEVERMFVAPFSADTLLVRVGISFVNNGNQLYLDGQNSVEVQLPQGAAQVQLDQAFASGFTTAEGPTPVIRSKNPLYPGEVNAIALQFSYLLPFQSGQEIAVPMDYPISLLAIHVPQTSGFVVGNSADSTFDPGDTVTLQDGVYNTYELQGGLAAAGIVRFSINGQETQNNDRRNVLAVVLFVAGLVLTLTVLAARRLNQQKAPTLSRKDTLIQQIADLDIRFSHGEIAQDQYEQARNQLKSELGPLID